MKKQKESDGCVRYLGDDELSCLLVACEVAKHPNTVVLITVSTDMRKTEVLNLFWKELKNPPTGKNGNIEAWGMVHPDQRKIIPLSGKVIAAKRLYRSKGLKA